MPSLLDKVKNKLGLKKQPPGHKLGGDDYSCQQQQIQQGSQSKPKLRRELSDQEKEARRDAMAAAAANRGQAWDKKVTKGAQTRRQEEKKKKMEQHSGNSSNSKEGDESFLVQTEETLRMVEEAKRSEQKLAETMGYNPYEPVMSSTANTKGGTGSSSSSSSSSVIPGSSQSSASQISGGNVSHRDPYTDLDDEEVKLPFVAAVECLLNQALAGVADESITSVFTAFPNAEDAAVFEQGKVCINTVVKMLSNLAANPDEPKFRSIRLNNKNFSGKVAEVEGGLELIMSAGFVLEEVLEEVEGASLASDISGAGGMSGTFLKHHGGPMAERQLEFTLSRLRHIQNFY